MISRLELTSYFEQHRQLNKGVEVGSYKGEFAKEILKKWNGKLYLIDIWNNHSFNQDDYINIIKNCTDNISSNEERCFMIRSTSSNAVELFNDQSLDFVYIDANHKYEYVKQDLELWFPKLRKGGVFAGHDYLKMDWDNQEDKHIWIGDTYSGEYGVNPAVDEFCKKHQYICNVTDEWWGSWYFIK